MDDRPLGKEYCNKLRGSMEKQGIPAYSGGYYALALPDAQLQGLKDKIDPSVAPPAEYLKSLRQLQQTYVGEYEKFYISTPKPTL